MGDIIQSIMLDEIHNLVKKFREYVSQLNEEFGEDSDLFEKVKEAEKQIIENLNNSGRVSLILENKLTFILIFYEAYVTNQYSVFSPTIEIATNNKKLIQPELQNAVEGEEEARIFYQNERLLCFSDFSEECQEYLLNAADQFVKNQKLLERHITDPEIRSYYSRKDLSKSFALPKEFHILSGITSVFTFASGKVILEDLEGRQYEKYTRYKNTGILNSIEIESEKFNPLSYGPIGKLAKDVFDKSINLMLKVRILDDLVDYLGFKITWANKKQILSSYREPWDLCKTNVYKNLLTLAEQKDAGMIDVSIIEEALGNFRLLNSSNINAFISKKKDSPKGDEKTFDLPKISLSKSTIASFHTKQSFIEGLLSSVIDPVDSDKVIAARLYSLYTRGMITYPESINLLEKGREPNADKAEINKHIENLIKERRSLYSKNIGDSETYIDEVVAETNDAVDENIVIQGRDSEWFNCWLEKLSKSDQYYVQKRLDKVAEGLFGRHAQLRANRRLYELKVSGEKEIRIYFIYSGQKEITLIHAGIKDNQDKDIDYAVSLI